MKNKNKKEKGIATILLVMLISFASLVIFAASTYELKGSQNNSVAEHELVQAQARAWTGAEAVRQVMFGLGASTAIQLPVGYAIPFNGNMNGVSAIVNSVDSTNKLITVNIVGCSDTTNSSCSLDNKNVQKGSVSVVQVVFSVAGSSSTNAVAANNVINIKGGISLSGGISINSNSPTSLVVDGTVTSNGFSGVNNLFATGDVNISGSGIGQNTVTTSLGNVNLTGSGTYGTVNSLKNVTLNGGLSAQVVQANGNVSVSSSTLGVVNSIGDISLAGSGNITAATTMGNINDTNGSISTANANGNVFISTGNNTTINAMGNVSVYQGTFPTINTNGTYSSLNGYGPTVQNLNAIGSITSSGGSINNAQTDGNLWQSNTSTSNALVKGTFTENSWGSLMNGKAGVAITKTQFWNTSVYGTVVPGLQVPITPVAAVNVTPLTLMTVSQPSVDANLLKNAANYVFSYTGGYIMVAVSNVYNVPSGNYYLYEGNIGSQSYRDYICTTPNPTSVSQCPARVGLGFSTWNTLITYNIGANQWQLSGSSLAPGVAFFNGDVSVTNGTFYNTFLSTGNVTLSGSATVYSVNYAGYSNVCVNANYPNYPTQLCNSGSSSYVSNPIGNIAVLAGSYLTNGNYNGGNINMTNGGTTVYGDLVAGNILQTSGSTTINGYVDAADLGGGGASTLNNSTTINLNNLPSTYNPYDGINLIYSTTGTNNQTTATPQCLVVSARYL